jgi:hypothetical protein
LGLSAWLEALDRRIVYILVVIVLMVPLMMQIRFPIRPTEPAKLFYETVQKTDPDKLIILCSDWDASILAECQPQTDAALEHIMRLGRKFAVIGFVDPQGAMLTKAKVERLAKDKYHEYEEYGRKWAYFGYRTPAGAWAFTQAVISDVPAAFGVDSHGTPCREIPVMKGVRDMIDHKDVSCCIEICGSAMYTYWIDFVYGQSRTPVCIGVTGVMAPTMFPYLDSRQCAGLLAGAKGAAEYEKLLGISQMGMKIMDSQNFAHVFVFLLIVIGNVGYFGARRAKER